MCKYIYYLLQLLSDVSRSGPAARALGCIGRHCHLHIFTQPGSKKGNAFMES